MTNTPITTPSNVSNVGPDTPKIHRAEAYSAKIDELCNTLLDSMHTIIKMSKFNEQLKTTTSDKSALIGMHLLLNLMLNLSCRTKK